ncbi:MAG: chromosomal replication initiator DnaA [Fusobacteriaceae bacterium]|nr:chromosomal replication initiator DnaA [Fusobacteriaceae bacterium]MBP6467285.1 chromosomal replication initiator DnaA [Fusobacteriaceae bacterium]MBP9596264.1 chromosomal replication initiator DnaA [Fusobacteriaceae bacterium]MBU9917566.1 chromosomal replication initiator DnaA [Fusobacteriaceae bacterium]
MDDELESELDIFDIDTHGDLLRGIEKITIEEKSLPDIEMREMVIRETGNFLNLQENVINIPIEMIVFPFFTPQKQNKRVNFKYQFQDLGVTMFCTLVSKDNEDMVFQPSIFEEKIYTYLISMYEKKRDINDTDDYIEFEISDYICGFLGNKMNRNYYSKVEQGLKNLKNTEYQFIVSNHSKLGKYKFEDEEFKLLTYKKLKIGKKVFYRVTLNNNIRQKIKDKRYIKYNSKNLLEILDKDVIASRIYKYISKIRYDKQEDEASIRALAAIIPLKTDQVVSRENNYGEKKKYRLNRIKQVIKRIEKAFSVLLKLGYIEKFKIVESSGEHLVRYMFNVEKDNECHISSYIEKKKTTIEYKKTGERKRKTKLKDVEEAILVDSVGHETHVNVDEAIKKAKRNIYISKAWNKRVENKINKIIAEHGEMFTASVLDKIYNRLTFEIKTTLVQYINGVVKTMQSEEKAKKKENLQLFEPKVIELKVEEQEEKQQVELSEEEVEILFNALDDIRKIEVEQKALEICEKQEGVAQAFLLQLKKRSEKIYKSTMSKFIGEVLTKEVV